MNVIKKLAGRVARTEFARKAIEDGTDLSALKVRPSARVCFGIFLVVIGHIFCWPAISLCGILSVCWHKPMIIIVGGPVLYVVAHLALFAGMYLAGREYALVFLKWATRVSLQKLL